MRKGIGVSAGIGRGSALRYEPKAVTISDAPAEDPAAEKAHFHTAVEAARTENEALRLAALARAGADEAEIFEAHGMILEDEDSFVSPVEELIEGEGLNAAAASARVLDEIAAMMEALEDENLRARAADFRDVRTLVLRHLSGEEGQDISHLSQDVILIARELTPSDTVRMDVSHVVGIICEEGGKTSHAAILAKAMGVPAVVGCGGILEKAQTGMTVQLDGYSGEVVCEPTPAEIEEFDRRYRVFLEEREALEVYRGKRAVTTDGHEVEVCANIVTPAECAVAVERDCQGVGLFRSEFLYMDRETLPDEEEQFEAYRKTLETAGERVVTIRTLDAGGDKKLPILTQQEENPFLGYRAIRICLRETELFKTQLRALYRASAYGNLRIMFPMISSLEELRRAKELCAEARAELTDRGVAFNPDVPLGIMVEIPAVAILADAFAAECDFFSIGTNDLTQYTVAVDRGNKQIEELYTHYHPAVLHLIAHSIEAAHRHNIPCCMCGEAAGDPVLIPVLLGMGLDEFSMSAPYILRAKKMICERSYEGCRELAQRTLLCSTAKDVRKLLR